MFYHNYMRPIFIAIALSLFAPLVVATAVPNQEDNKATVELFDKNIDAIYQRIGQFLSTYSLAPFVKGDNWHYQAQGFEVVPSAEKEDIAAVIIGDVSKDNDKYKIAFLITQDKKTSEIKKVIFLYMGNTTISLQLLADMLPLAYVKAELDSKNPSYLFIKKTNDDEKSIEEDWIFFNEKILKTLKVVLKNDGKGGTYFDIK